MTGKAPSKQLQLRDKTVSAAFDYFVAWQMNEWRDEREIARMEALAGAAPFSQAPLVEMIRHD
jgi:hypothetical protein